ncbi:MAG: hypothetical protein M0Z41_13995 [Peptococcaceae bacterium]|nr:hypothetical protein [Peptococcaceae bacterium]
MRPVLSNTEDTPLRVSFAGADIVADKTALEKVVGSEWPRGTRLPTSGLKGNLADINKAGRVRWLSGNLISMEVGGVARDVWVFVPFDYGVQGDFAHNLDGAQVTSGVHGKPFLVQSRPDWWKNGFFVPAPSDAPYLLSAADLAYVPVIPPAAVRYQPVKDPQAVVDWLAARDSAEAGIEYLTMLDRAGKTYNINPLLLLAITGQEQSFVPKFLDDWPQVIRNPFNVFYSWQGYSPGFLPTAMIAAETVNRLSNGCPAGVNPIEWIDSPANPNDRYAGDTNWWKGVSVFFSILEKVGGG